jgi:hypothetical protein
MGTSGHFAGAGASHPQHIARPANVGTSFNLPLPSIHCGWDSRGPRRAEPGGKAETPIGA